MWQQKILRATTKMKTPQATAMPGAAKWIVQILNGENGKFYVLSILPQFLKKCQKKKHTTLLYIGGYTGFPEEDGRLCQFNTLSVLESHWIDDAKVLLTHQEEE